MHDVNIAEMETKPDACNHRKMVPHVPSSQYVRSGHTSFLGKLRRLSTFSFTLGKVLISPPLDSSKEK